jgi:hypothetical protein
MMALPNSSPERVQGLVIGLGLLTFVSVGVAACLALVVVVFWLAVQVVLYLLQAVVETFSSIGLIWVNADPFVKVVILAGLAYGGYRIYQLKRRGKRYA